jgi:phosphoribosylanthranilate isomerase
MSLTVKICGLTEPLSLSAALDAGADMVGFVFYEPSPRHLAMSAARELSALVEGRAKKVVLCVDADDALLAALIEAVDPDLLQLHGRETPERVAAVRMRFGLPVMRALAIRTRADLDQLAAFEAVADALLFDAKPPADATRPGGNGESFDWTVLNGLATRRPWLLAGGLTLANVAHALAVSGAQALDVSSGVESAPGHKDPAKIKAFVAQARDSHARLDRGGPSLTKDGSKAREASRKGSAR